MEPLPSDSTLNPQAALDPEPGAEDGDNVLSNLAAAAQQGPLIRQVFISHTGQHAAASTFAASILKPALQNAGVPVFMDFSSLPIGCKWPDKLVDAAANSAVMVVVLTKEYTQRYWCMLELDLALHSRSTTQLQQGQQQPLIIPVFYDDPDEVIRLEEIKEYWQGEGMQQVPVSRRHLVDPERWTANIKAMYKLQAARRYTLEASKDRDFQLARRVVQAAVAATPGQLHTGPVYGLEEQEAHLIAELVVPESDRTGVWLHGLGGCGKSTLATILYNRLAPRYQHRAVVELDCEEKISSQQLSNLLEQLGASGFNKSRPAKELLATLHSFVQDKRVLLVVDNVWRAGQLNDLLPRSFRRGSCIIITSRSDGLPDSSWWQQVKRQLLSHPLQNLPKAAAKQLLRGAAGLGVNFQMPDELQTAEENLIAACNGLPLALQLSGSFLQCMTHDVPRPLEKWKEALAALSYGRSAVDSEGRLGGILSLSFAVLDQAQQHMFLDVATALRGQQKELALIAWTAWHGRDAASLFEDLTRRNLLSSDTKGNLQMHDVLAYLGCSLLRHCSPVLPQQLHGSRVWMQGGSLDGYQQGASVLTAQLGHVQKKTLRPVDMQQLLLTDLSKARIMLIGRVALLEGDQPYACLNDLLWLCTPAPVFIASQPFHCLTNLRVLVLEDCYQLDSVPQSFTKLTALQHVHMHDCNNLRELPESFCQLTKLQCLCLGDCDLQPTLSNLWVHPSSLETLVPRSCRQPRFGFVQLLPESFGKLSLLQALYLKGCRQLQALPDSFGQLSSLHTLELWCCEQLQELPESFGQLSSLRSLELRFCPQLYALPESFGQLSTLQTLNLESCKQLQKLPKSIGQLSKLQTLHLQGCEQLQTLPDSFGQLSSLQRLALSCCKRLQALPASFGQLSALEVLEMRDCPELTSLPGSITQLIALQHLNVEHCTRLAASSAARRHLADLPDTVAVKRGWSWHYSALLPAKGQNLLDS